MECEMNEMDCIEVINKKERHAKVVFEEDDLCLFSDGIDTWTPFD